jgi:hypothetical protein
MDQWIGCCEIIIAWIMKDRNGWLDLLEIPERTPPKPLPRGFYEYDEYECVS